MIQIKRINPPPNSLQKSKTQKAKEEIESIIISGDKLKSTDFPPLWREKDIRQQLWKMQHGKCCYCERKRDIYRESDVEHFRPKTQVFESLSQSGYWWLAYDWKNYFFSCKTCNEEFKRTHFPLIDESKRATSPCEDLDLEEPYLLNPETDNPENYIMYTFGKKNNNLNFKKFVFMCSFDEKSKGIKTIEILGLNRPELLLERASLIPTLLILARKMQVALQYGNELLFNEACEEIWNETSSERNFCGFRRFFFMLQGLDKYIADN